MQRRLRQTLQNQSGLAMVLVLCIGALFLALSTAMLHGASLLTASANRLLPQEDCYQLACTFAGLVEAELTDAGKTGAGLQQFVNDSFLSDRYADDQVYSFAAAEQDGCALRIELTKSPTQPGGTLMHQEFSKPEPGSARSLVEELDAFDSLSAGGIWDETITVAVTAVTATAQQTFAQDYRRLAFYSSCYTNAASARRYTHEPGTLRFTAQDGSVLTLDPADANAVDAMTGIRCDGVYVFEKQEATG